MLGSPEGLFPITQDNAQAAFDWMFAPWVREMGLTDFEVSKGRVAMRLPLHDRLLFAAGAVCGQALMAGIDTAASMAVSTTERSTRGTIYQHTHFLRPAANDDFRIEAKVLRFGRSSTYVECNVSFAGSGELVAHAVLEFAF